MSFYNTVVALTREPCGFQIVHLKHQVSKAYHAVSEYSDCADRSQEPEEK